MIRRNSIVALAMVALAFVSMSFAEAGGSRGGGKGRPAAPPAPPAPAATTRTVVNNTSRSWYTYVHSGNLPPAFTIAEGNAEGAKVIAPGGKGVFNVKPEGQSRFGDLIVINATPPLDVNNPNASFRSWDQGNGNDASYPSLQAGQNSTITITQTSPTAVPSFNPPAP